MTERNLRGPQPLRPDELDDGEGGDLELHEAHDAGRLLQAAIDDVPIRPSEDFTRRVMAVINQEAAPGAVGFLTPLRRRGILAGFGDSVRQAWAAIGAPSRPSFARATALAYVLVVAIAGAALAGAATVGVGSALGVFGPTRPTDVPIAQPTPTPEPGLPTPGPQTAPVPTAEPGESEEPPDGSGGPDASDDHAGQSEEPGDDHGESSSPGSSGTDDPSGSDDGSGSGSGESETPHPSDTPRPTGTPKPSETPH